MYLNEGNTRKGRVKIIYINKRQESSLLWINEIAIDRMFIFIIYGKRRGYMEGFNLRRIAIISKYEKSI